MKKEEGVIQSEKIDFAGSIMETFIAFGDKKVYTYARMSLADTAEVIELTVSTVNVINTDNYTYYDVENGKVDEEASYVWFDNDIILDGTDYAECGLKPGKYNAKEIKSKCGISMSIDNNYGQSYIFKTSEDGIKAYNVISESLVSPDYIDKDDEYDVKTYSELNDIINSYPQSSSVIIPSMLIILAVLFILL